MIKSCIRQTFFPFRWQNICAFFYYSVRSQHELCRSKAPWRREFFFTVNSICCWLFSKSVISPDNLIILLHLSRSINVLMSPCATNDKSYQNNIACDYNKLLKHYWGSSSDDVIISWLLEGWLCPVRLIDFVFPILIHFVSIIDKYLKKCFFLFPFVINDDTLIVSKIYSRPNTTLMFILLNQQKTQRRYTS